MGLKTAYTQLFPDLFSRTAPTGNNQPDMRELMLAEIRALTGGDVTKNEAVLHADTMDALAELNAKAREAREMNEHLNKSKAMTHSLTHYMARMASECRLCAQTSSRL